MAKRKKSPKFLMVLDYLYRSKAFQSLDGNARSVYLELLARYNGHNNGMIGLSSREAGAVINKGNDTGARALDMLLDRGFIAIASDSTFNQKKLAREWRLTHVSDDRTGHAASKEFMRWGLENQKPVAQVRSIVAQVRKETSKSEKTQPHSRTGATVLPKWDQPQSHRCDTSRSTIPPPAERAQDATEEAPPQQGARTPEERTSGGSFTDAPTVSASLLSSKAIAGMSRNGPTPKRDFAPSAELVALISSERQP